MYAPVTRGRTHFWVDVEYLIDEHHYLFPDRILWEQYAEVIIIRYCKRFTIMEMSHVKH